MSVFSRHADVGVTATGVVGDIRFIPFPLILFHVGGDMVSPLPDFGADMCCFFHIVNDIGVTLDDIGSDMRERGPCRW